MWIHWWVMLSEPFRPAWCHVWSCKSCRRSKAIWGPDSNTRVRSWKRYADSKMISLEGLLSHNHQYWSWARIWRRSNCALPPPPHLAGQTEGITRGVLSSESSQHYEPTCNPGGLCCRDLPSGVPCRNSCQELTTARNARVLSSQIVLHL